MHELPIAENILDIALRHAQGHQITDIFLEIGQLSSIIDNSIQGFWDLISKGTMAEGANLHFQRIPTEMQCRDCLIRFTPNQDGYTCPKCSSLSVMVVAGGEFSVNAIEVVT